MFMQEKDFGKSNILVIGYKINPITNLLIDM